MRNCRETTLRNMTTRLQQRTDCGEKESAGSVCILLIFILIARRPDIRSLDAFYSFFRRPHPFAFVGTREGVDARAQTNTLALSSRSATTGVTSWPRAADEASSAFRGRTRRTGADQPHSRSKPIAKDWEEAVDSATSRTSGIIREPRSVIARGREDGVCGGGPGSGGRAAGPRLS